MEIRTIKNLEVITNTQPATYPDGMDISIFKFYLLKKAYLKAKKKSDLEHVTPFIYRIKNIKKENFNDKQNLSNVRITLDDSNDLEFLNFIFKELKQNIHFNYKNLKKLIFKLRKNNNSLTIQPFEVMHGMIKSTAYVFEKIAYISDCNKIPKKHYKNLYNLNYLIIDCLRNKKHPSHFNYEDALELIKKIKPKKSILTNLHVDLDYLKLKKKLPKNIIPAYDGLSFNF